MLLPITSRSNNFKQLVLRGPMAIVETILLLLNTPLNTSQEDPNYGFNINDFLFRVPNSEECTELENEFNNKLKTYLNRSNVSATFSREDRGRTIVINIKTEDEFGVINLPISVTDKGEVQVLDKIILE